MNSVDGIGLLSLIDFSALSGKEKGHLQILFTRKIRVQTKHMLQQMVIRQLTSSDE